MARRLKEATEAPKRGVSCDITISYDRKISEAEERLGEARGEVGQFNSQFKKMGGDTQALKLARKLKRMTPLKAEAYWSQLKQFIADLQVFNQSSMFDENTTTPADTAAAEKRNEIAEAQGKQAGLDGDNLDSNPYPDDDAARPFWSKGWREGQNENADKFKAPAGGDQPAPQADADAAPAAAEKPAAPVELELPAALDRRRNRKASAEAVH
jgi:ribosome modulation factor